MTTYILGSGFSKHSGAPLTREIIPKIFDSKRTQDSFLSSWLKNHLFEGQSNWLNEHKSIEEILSRLELFSHYHNDNAETKEAQDIISNIVLEILSLLHPLNLPDPPSIYHLFTEQLSKKDVIITFNYDLVLEKVFSLKKIPWSYEDKSDLINVIKPHGSLNYFYCPYCNFFFYLEVFKVPKSLKLPCRKCQKIIDLPYIVTPSLYKSYSEKYRKEAKKVFDVLTTTSDLVFIGYSLSMADALIYQLFDLASYLNPKLKRVTIANGPNYDCTPYTQIYSPEILNNTGLYFEKYLEDLTG